MNLEEIFRDRALALVVQAILLIAAVIYTSQGGPDIFIVLSITTILALYVLQVFNRRFRYYFPVNNFFVKNTKMADTYMLYVLTFIAFFFFLMGLTHKMLYAVILSLTIILPGPIWRLWISKKLLSNFESDIKKEEYIISLITCPACGGNAVQVGSFCERNVAIAVGRCLDTTVRL